ncbi:hypothetical protein AGABI1DRAFT_112158 [Agaricus bisporus var. burnettii JB137-S8]|uniref:Uncharacterized protein n=1 Tax=Agaricus bisporus var. burnettii (strain JB137-S8 / ATCC MYA-4627 / FGSC 10392) TaxID=597362 RepID=K5X2D7_AGABU|nr:uncharacterized protein AGABI1DRAFT_112158 [Agaricus bisporus var. burnettii JB137-S8]EKM81981.1 hypothetical protein AGABI1DRAFT_112158 [Agaricus bisporus var. burnettii JB137-S8]
MIKKPRNYAYATYSHKRLSFNMRLHNLLVATPRTSATGKNQDVGCETPRAPTPRIIRQS